MTDDQAALRRFGGVARLFPLPNVVLFPQVVQGLHVFEPRYRQMTADALADDRLIAVVLLKSDREDDPRPPVEGVACLGRITHHEHFPDGRYNLRLRGIGRLRLAEELPTDKLYRKARAELLPDVIPEDLPRLKELRRELAEAVLPRFDPEGPAHRHLRDLFDGELPLGALTDMLAYALPVPTELKQELLAEPRVDYRAEVLAHSLRLPEYAEERKFPPEFSAN